MLSPELCCTLPPRPMIPTLACTNVGTAQDTFMKALFAMVTRNARMKAMKVPCLAKGSVKSTTMKELIFTSVVMVVASIFLHFAVHVFNPFVELAVTWLPPFVITSVISNTQELRIRTVGHVPMAPSVSSKPLSVMEILIVRMAVMKRTVPWSPRLD